MLEVQSFKEYWETNFKNIPPLGHELRSGLQNRWIRFHALPDAKRYADTALERKTIIERANKLADELLGNNSECWLVGSCEAWDDEGNGAVNNLRKRYSLEYAFDWSEVLEGEEQHSFHVKRVTWVSNQFDDIFESIAEDRERALFVNTTTNAVFAPYDGGYDLITNGRTHVENLKHKFSHWMSKREDWL